ncbi:MAG: type II toxin-antitoxin system RelE/ParE family toxin [Verrucomicrobiota bacterium]
MQVQILKEAETEFWKAVTDYEQTESDLGVRFSDEVLRHIGMIEQHPTLPRLRSGRYRRVNLDIFPFYIAYHIRSETIYVVAIAHSKRKPNYWKDRN